MANGVREIQDSEFNEAIASGTVLVDFWAPWCGPCRMQGPILEEVAAEVGSKAVIAKVNVDSNQGAAGQFGVSSIPTLILFHDGKPVQNYVGVQQKETLVDAIEQAANVSA